MSKRPTLIYIAGIGHSGSTLLTLLLSAHSQVATIGEIKALSPGSSRPLAPRLAEPCTCGAADKHACAFWQAFAAHLAATYQLSPAELDVRSADPDTFRRHNQAVLATIQHLSGADFIVDSSKDLRRLAPLLADGSFAIRPVLIQRAVHGVVYSEMKKGRPWPQQAERYREQFARLRAALAPHDYYHLRYEQLARQPRSTLQALLAWLGLPFEASQLAWADQNVHILAGNRMRFNGDSAIRFDETWRRRLTLKQKMGISWMASPLFQHTAGLRHLFPLVPGQWRENL